MSKLIKKLPSGLWLLLICILLNVIFSFSETLTDLVYFKTVFQGIRWMVDNSVSKLPFPLVGILFIVLIGALIYAGYWIATRRNILSRRVFWSKLSLGIISFIGWTLSLFYFLWGFNYHNPSLEKRLDLTMQPISAEQLLEKIEKVETQVIQLRNEVSTDTTQAITPDIDKDQLEKQLRVLQKKLLGYWDIPSQGNVRVRKLKPGGLLLSFSTQGIYIPFVSEGHIDGGIHPLIWPSTLAHEMAHGYGFTGEGTCEFVSFMTCSLSENPLIRYSGWLNYYEYLLRDYRRNDPEGFKTYRENMPSSLLTDFKAIRSYSDRYPRLIPQLQSKIHNNYLKAHGIKEGKLNYNRIVMLVDAWERKVKEVGKAQ